MSWKITFLGWKCVNLVMSVYTLSQPSGTHWSRIQLFFFAIKPNLSVSVSPKACASLSERVERMGFLPSLIFTFRWCHLCAGTGELGGVCWQAPGINIEMRAVTQRNGAYMCLTHRHANEGYFQNIPVQCAEQGMCLISP